MSRPSPQETPAPQHLPHPEAMEATISTEQPDQPSLTARIREAMARHAAIEPRGFDSVKEREALHAEIDALLDELSTEQVTQ